MTAGVLGFEVLVGCSADRPAGLTLVAAVLSYKDFNSFNDIDLNVALDRDSSGEVSNYWIMTDRATSDDSVSSLLILVEYRLIHN